MNDMTSNMKDEQDQYEVILNIFCDFSLNDRTTDRPTNQPTDQPTEPLMAHLKRPFYSIFHQVSEILAQFFPTGNLISLTCFIILLH